MNAALRAEIARILEKVARDGLPNSRALDLALDAIEFAFEQEGYGDDDSDYN